MKQFNGQKILVVEDNLMSSKLIEVHFSRSNLQIFHAIDGPGALEVFNNQSDIAAVLMDIQLPGINGLEVTRMIKKINPEMPVIAATANVFDDDRIACMEAGCNYYITKPINFPDLFDILENLLG